jgi:hypothetical protein
MINTPEGELLRASRAMLPTAFAPSHLRPAHGSRRPPQSLSLGSSGDFRRSMMKAFFLIGLSAPILFAGCATVSREHVTTANQRLFQISKLDSIGYGLRSYHLFHRRFPPTGADVAILIQPDPEASGTASIAATKSQVRSGRYPDLWGSNYILQTNGSICCVTSRGADGLVGTRDDFVLRVTPTNQRFLSLPTVQ